MNITHHISNQLLHEYALGELDFATSLVVASHVSLCDQCRAEIETLDVLGAAVFMNDNIPPDAALEGRVLAAIASAPSRSMRQHARKPYPQPIMDALEGNEPIWKSLGAGVKQSIISRENQSSVRLLRIETGRPVPEHGHHGQELTLVLQGGFEDETGAYRVGDVEMADEDLLHQPVAMEGEPCICLASTSGNLRFKNLIPRILQPVFGI